MRYRLNEGQVVSEILDGEVIAIHLETGAYYSMQGGGAAIWNALLAGATAAEIAAALAPENPRAHAEIEIFLAELLAEELLIPASAAAPPPPSGPYAPPTLQKYTDMQELLLVDPIHEVTEEGWPLRA